MKYSVGKPITTILRMTPVGAAGLMAVDKIKNPKKSGTQVVKDNFLLNPVEGVGKLSQEIGVTKKDVVKSTNVGQLAADAYTVSDPISMVSKVVPQTIAGGPKSVVKIGAKRAVQDVGITTNLIKCGVSGTVAGGGAAVETVLGLPESTSKYALVSLAGLMGAYASKSMLDTPWQGTLFAGIVSSYALYTYYPSYKADCNPLLWDPKTKESKSLTTRNVMMASKATKKIVVFSAYTAALFVLVAYARVYLRRTAAAAA